MEIPDAPPPWFIVVMFIVILLALGTVLGIGGWAVIEIVKWVTAQ